VLASALGGCGRNNKFTPLLTTQQQNYPTIKTLSIPSGVTTELISFRPTATFKTDLQPCGRNNKCTPLLTTKTTNYPTIKISLYPTGSYNRVDIIQTYRNFQNRFTPITEHQKQVRTLHQWCSRQLITDLIEARSYRFGEVGRWNPQIRGGQVELITQSFRILVLSRLYC